MATPLSLTDLGTLDALLPVNLRRTLAVCAKCGAGDLEHFYTSKRDSRTLCAGCFEQRVERGLAREARARGSRQPQTDGPVFRVRVLTESN